jgi:hypothetical protein
MTSDGPGSPSTQSLVLVPALITLAVTLLRLTGELLGWSPVFFARAAGGAAAIVGIVWLVPVFGFLFARRLAGSGPAPTAGGVIGHALLAIGVMIASVFLAMGVLKVGQGAQFGVFIVAGVVAAWIAYRAWPRLGQVLLAYGLAARVPVVLVMLVAIYANWGTHYDVSPPNFAEMAPLPKWFLIGFIPQLFLWVPFTMFVGALCGGIALLFSGSARQPATN